MNYFGFALLYLAKKAVDCRNKKLLTPRFLLKVLASRLKTATTELLRFVVTGKTCSDKAIPRSHEGLMSPSSECQ